MAALTGKVALITGAGSGIGEAVARRFLAEGAKVMITDLDERKGSALVKSLGPNARFMRGDHCSMADNKAAVAATVAAFGALHVLHNNAGMPQRSPIDTLTEADLRKTMDVNVVGPFLMTQAALPELRKAAKAGAGPAILVTASIQSIFVRPNMSAYAASKHAVAGFIATLALELAAEGIRVNGVCPGPVDTALFRSIASTISNDIDASMGVFQRTVPMGRLIKAEEVAAAALFLCSAEASAITGVLLPVDGGITAR